MYKGACEGGSLEMETEIWHGLYLRCGIFIWLNIMGVSGSAAAAASEGVVNPLFRLHRQGAARLHAELDLLGRQLDATFPMNPVHDGLSLLHTLK